MPVEFKKNKDNRAENIVPIQEAQPASVEETIATVDESARRVGEDFEREGDAQAASLENIQGDSSEIEQTNESAEAQAEIAERQLKGLMELMKGIREGKKGDILLAEILKNFCPKTERTASQEGNADQAEKGEPTAWELLSQTVEEYKGRTPETKEKEGEEDVAMKKEIEERINREAVVLAEKLKGKLAPVLGDAAPILDQIPVEGQISKWVGKIREKGEQFVADVLAGAVREIRDTESMNTVRGVWNKLPLWMQETVTGVGRGGEVVRYSMIPILKDVQSWMGFAVQTGLLEMKGTLDSEKDSNRIDKSQNREVAVFNTAVKVFGAQYGASPESCAKLSSFARVGVGVRQGIVEKVRNAVREDRKE